MLNKLFFLLLMYPFIFACKSGEKQPEPKEPKFRLIGEKQLASGLMFQNTQVGGFSGIDLGQDGTWYIISDDQSQYNPARFYKAALNYDEKGFHSFELKSVHTLKQSDGSLYPSLQDARQRAQNSFADAESIRLDVENGNLYWTSEGTETSVTKVNPFISVINKEGMFVSQMPTPSMFRFGNGITANKTFEAICLIPDSPHLWVCTEAPLNQDGSAPTPELSNSLLRLTRLNRQTGEIIAQFAYLPDKVQAVPVPANGIAENGLVELLYLDENRLLTLERSFSIGVGNSIRLYEVNLSGANDVKDISALVNSGVQPVQKKLLLDLKDLGLNYIDNIEGMCWGKTLNNGQRTLVFVADNNFSNLQLTQLIVCEVPDL